MSTSLSDLHFQGHIEDERAKVLGTLSNLEKGVEGWIYVVSKGMTKGWERGQNFIGDEWEGGLRMTERFQASVIRGLFGCKERYIGLLPSLCFMAVSPWVRHVVPLSLSLPVLKMGLTVTALPTS